MYILGHFEDAKKTDASEDGNTQRWYHFRVCEHNLEYATHHYKAIKAVEQGDKITLQVTPSSRKIN